MIFLKIYIGFCLVTFLVVEMVMYEIQQQAKRKYADKISENRDKQKQNFLEKLCGHIKTFIICFVPIMNILMFWAFLFNGVKVQEAAFNKINEQLKEK